MVAAPYEMFNMGNKTHPQQPDLGNCNFLIYFIQFMSTEKQNLKKARKMN